jgi:hypothetical protein
MQTPQLFIGIDVHKKSWSGNMWELRCVRCFSNMNAEKCKGLTLFNMASNHSGIIFSRQNRIKK